MRALASRYRVWLFIGGAGRTSRPTWELPYIVGHTELDTQDTEAMIAEARRLRESVEISGLICYDESRIIYTAEVAHAVGLPTSSADSIRRCRDKHRTRVALAEAGVPQAASHAVHSAEEAAQVAEQLGYPVVLKPRSMAASFGVSRVDSAADLAEGYRLAMSIALPEEPTHYEDAVLVEEFLDGPEISVDSACFDGRLVPLAVAHKELGFEPCFEEVGHVVDGNDPLLDDPHLLDVLSRAHAAVGYETGMTHTELRRTSDGTFKVIEINARLGGDMIPYLGQLATDIDLSLASAAIACGQEPDLTRGPGRVAAIRFYYPDQDITVTGARIAEALLPSEVDRADMFAQPGQEMKLPPRGSAWESRLAQVVAVADSEAACRAVLDEAAKAITVEASAVQGQK
jgi:biotin carboxylase